MAANGKEGVFLMSGRERDSIGVFERVKSGEIKLRQAADILGISYRQAKRRYTRYREEGAKGLVHRLRGLKSNRRLAEETIQLITDLYKTRYADFGPVLFSEKLLSVHNIRTGHETLRRLLIKEGLWRQKQRKRGGHKAWRER